jgi:DGQHR domain-containing protein
MANNFVYRAVQARQSASHRVLTFAARAQDILAFAEIDRVRRDNGGALKGFQRPQIAAHIREIRDYLSYKDSVLPNSVVIAFTDRVEVSDIGKGLVEIQIDATRGKPGLVVDGQQRLTALAALPEKEFEVFVSVLICPNHDELRRQFVLINNTRPLPKALIYELLPSVEGLPERLSSRSSAASLAARLNYDSASSLKGLIYQHTNPTGVIRDTAIQKVIMASASDGAIRQLSVEPNSSELAFELLSAFYGAVQDVFSDEWHHQTPKTSRLVHGAGIIAMGYVMELLHSRQGARSRADFREGLKCLVGRTAWTKGAWRFGAEEVVPWNAVQNVPRQIMALAHYLVGIVKKSTSAPEASFEMTRIKINRESADLFPRGR